MRAPQVKDVAEPLPKPMAEQIAASIEDVQALLDDNRSLSVAFLARRIRDLEDSTRERFREVRCPCKAIGEAEEAITELAKRLDQAAVKFKEMREEVDQLKLKAAKAKPSGET
jgi:chromosome segregation ATPase